MCRVIVSSPMSLRTLSGVESLRGVERTGSLPEERFINAFPAHSAGSQPSQVASEPSRLERRNSLPSKRDVIFIAVCVTKLSTNHRITEYCKLRYNCLRRDDWKFVRQVFSYVSEMLFSLYPIPVQSKDRHRVTSDPVIKFPPIQNGPYPNFVGQGSWQQIPETQMPHREVAPGKNCTWFVTNNL